MKTKKIMLIIALVILNSCIFFFSNQTGEKSESLSDAFTIKVIDKYSEIKGEEYTPKEKNKIVVNSRFLVRKGAHFTIYLLEGILLYELILCYEVKRPHILTILICFLLASLDEFHQLFSVGRTARLYDIAIDTVGSTIGITISCWIKKMLKRKEK